MALVTVVKKNADNDRGNPLPLFHGLHLLISDLGFLYAPSHIQDSTYTNLCYTTFGVLGATINSSVCLPREIDPTTYQTSPLLLSYVLLPQTQLEHTDLLNIVY